MYTLSIGLVIAGSELWEDVQTALAGENIRVAFERNELGGWSEFLERLDKTQPDVLIVDLAQLDDPLEEVIRQIKATKGSPLVIVVHPTAEPETILRAIRSQADEFVYPPVKNDLQNALKRMAVSRAQVKAGTRPRGKVLGFLSAKGGCGATTMACHLAYEMQRQTELQILLADFDVHSGVIGFLVKAQNRYSVLDAVSNVQRMDLSFWKALVSNGHPGVDVLAAPSNPTGAGAGDPDDYMDVLRFVRSNYDWTLVDLGRSITALSLGVADELDSLFVVTTLEIPALHQTKNMVQSLLDKGYAGHRLRLILNRMPKRTDVSLSELERMIGIPVFDTIPNDYPTLYDTYAEGALLSPKTRLGKNYSRLAAKVAGVQHMQKKRGFLFLA